jgi:predicted nicotinamide N-methyase
MTDADAMLDPESLIEDSVLLPWSGLTVRILRPAGIEDLIDRVEHDPEENLPYFAQVWPSGIALADLLAEQPEFVAHRRTLEVGCGLGITAIAASRAGALLTIADYFPASLDLTAANLERSGAPAVKARQLNWRDQASVDALASDGPFQIVIAADVLYESRDIAPLRSFFDHVLAPSGTLILAEPGRPVAARFLNDAATKGWDVGEIARHNGPWPDAKDTAVSVRIHTLRRRID